MAARTVSSHNGATFLVYSCSTRLRVVLLHARQSWRGCPVYRSLAACSMPLPHYHPQQRLCPRHMIDQRAVRETCTDYVAHLTYPDRYG